MASEPGGAERVHAAHLHRLLWQCEAGPEHAERRDALRSRWWTVYHQWRRETGQR